ncbi:response regulator transcription factor [Labilithrix luteola]|uniref:response regulator transcription factor n=1 Tax=Labilithrix luteola TaxID=1391654 RepID=UPI00147471E2|nr:helix-turn-helix transcriptional regulator [Labilithrix luteola]
MATSLVRTDAVRRLWRAVSEAREIRDGRAEQQVHVASELARIVNAQVCAFAMVEDFRPGGQGQVVSVQDCGWATSSEREFVWGTFGQQGTIYDPVNQVIMRNWNWTSPTELAVIRREDVVANGDWYDAPMIHDTYRPCRIDHSIYAMHGTGKPGQAYGLGIKKSWGERPYSEEDRNLVELLVAECGWLWSPDRRLAVAALTPRERETLEYLLDGASLKEIAYELKLSRHTVDGYVKAIHKTLGVHSRAELVSRFLNANR